MYSDKNFDQIFSLDPDETKTKPAVDVNKSDLLGAILAGIPGVDGYPITKEAEDMLKPTQQPVPLADIPPKVDIKPKSPVTQKAPLQLEEMVIKAPQAVSKPAGPADKGIGLRGKPDVLEPMTTPAEPIPEPTPELPTPQIQPAAPISDVDQELLDAQAERKKMRMIQALLEAGGNLGQAISGGPVEKDMLKGFDDVVNEPMTSLKERRDAKKAKAAEQRAADEFKQNQEKHALTMDKLKMESEDEKSRRDPNSLYSQATRAFQKQRLATIAETSEGKVKFDPTVLDDMSADLLEKSFGKPNLENLTGIVLQSNAQKETAAARREESKLNREARKEMQQLALQEKDKALQEKAKEKIERFAQSYRKEAKEGPVTAKLYNNFLTSQRMQDSLAQFLKNPSGYSDYATLMGGLKTLQGDDSVVREAEMKMGMQAGSLADKINNHISSLTTGKMLQPKQREDIAKTIRIMSDIGKRSYMDHIGPILKQAKEQGIDQALILPETLNENAEKSKEIETTMSAQDEARIKFVMDKNPNASREEVIKELKSQGKIGK